MGTATARILYIGLAILAFSSPAFAGKRVALVIGNDTYESLPVLKKAVNDARAVSETLEEIGFTVIRGENLTRREMNRKLVDLEARIEPGDDVFFFFAGHGVALGGDNFLIPSDMPRPRVGEETLVRGEAFAVNTLVSRAQARGARASFFVLDACRDNPFGAAGVRSIGGTRGLTRVDAPSGVFVLFSAGIGQTALDRLSDADPDPNSVFTRKLVPLLKTPGLNHVRLAKRVQQEVSALAGTVSHRQQPAYYDQIIGEIVLRAGSVQKEARPKALAPVAPAAQAWVTIQTSSSTAVLEAFIGEFPDSVYATFAKARLKELAEQKIAVAPLPKEAETTAERPADGRRTEAAPIQVPEPRAATPHVLNEHTYVSGSGDCKSLCDGRAGCTRFSYVAATKRCDLYSESSADRRANADPSSYDYTFVGDRTACKSVCEMQAGCERFHYDDGTKRCALFSGAASPRPTERHASARDRLGAEPRRQGSSALQKEQEGATVTYVGDDSDCRNLCNRQAGCKQFQYEAGTKKCSLFSSAASARPAERHASARDRVDTGRRHQGSHAKQGELTADTVTYVGDDSDCRNLCNRQSGCNRFAYEAGTKKCYLYTGGQFAPKRDANTASYTHTYVGNDGDCRTLCNSQPNCGRFQFDFGTRKCSLFSGGANYSVGELTLALQSELKRVNCDPGKLDGVWGSQGRSALARFNRYARLTLPIEEPTIKAIDAIKAERSRVCPR